MSRTPEARVSRAANWLTLSGALPFIVLTALVPLGEEVANVFGNPVLSLQAGWWATTALILYAGAILSFLGGIRFGAPIGALTGLHPTPMENSGRTMAVAVLPSLLAWALMIAGCLGQFSGFTVVSAVVLALFAVGFVLQWLWDGSSAYEGDMPEWFGKMRRRITFIVAPLLAFAAVAVWLNL